MPGPSTRSKAIAVALFSLPAVLGGAVGCSSPGRGDTSDPDCPSLSTQCPPAAPSWQNEVQPLIVADCAECHGKGGIERPLFDSTTYQSVYESRSAMVTALVQCAMPPSGASPPATLPDSAQRQTMVSWLACGAPDN